MDLFKLLILMIVVINSILEYMGYISPNIKNVIKNIQNSFKKRPKTFMLYFITLTILFDRIIIYLIILIIFSIFYVLSLILISIIYKRNLIIMVINKKNIFKMIGFTFIYNFKQLKPDLKTIIKLCYAYLTKIYFFPIYIAIFLTDFFDIIRILEKKGCKWEQCKKDAREVRFQINILFLKMFVNKRIIIKDQKILFNPFKFNIKNPKQIIEQTLSWTQENIYDTKWVNVYTHERDHAALETTYKNGDKAWLIFTSKPNTYIKENQKIPNYKLTENQFFILGQNEKDILKTLTEENNELMGQTVLNFEKTLSLYTYQHFQFNLEWKIIYQSMTTKEYVLIKSETALPMHQAIASHIKIPTLTLKLNMDEMQMMENVKNQLMSIKNDNPGDVVKQLIETKLYLDIQTGVENTNMLFYNIRKSFDDNIKHVLEINKNHENKIFNEYLMKSSESIEKTNIIQFKNFALEIRELVNKFY